MKIENRLTSVFIAADGREFDNIDDCQKYEYTLTTKVENPALHDRFWIKYINEDSSSNGNVYLVTEIVDERDFYYIADGKPHVGGGKLLRKYCHLITNKKNIPE